MCHSDESLCLPGGAGATLSLVCAGEIIPQAVCTRYGLAVGAYSAWFVQVLMALTSPLSYPLSRLLDWVLGSEHTARSKSSSCPACSCLSERAIANVCRQVLFVAGLEDYVNPPGRRACKHNDVWHHRGGRVVWAQRTFWRTQLRGDTGKTVKKWERGVAGYLLVHAADSEMGRAQCAGGLCGDGVEKDDVCGGGHLLAHAAGASAGHPWAEAPRAAHWSDHAVSATQGIFRRTQLKAMLDIHGVEEGLGGDLTADEIGIIRGALDLSHKTAATCMTPYDKARCPPAQA